MDRAIALARRGMGLVEPNPLVGCVIVRDGACVGEGFHRRFGADHAEVDALQSLQEPELAKAATAYVTLEPCCHTGKTPPCTAALIAAGVQRVVVAMKDPFPKVDGGGIEQLRAAGIEVELGVAQAAAEDLNAPYLKRLRHSRPWVIAKWAMSLDGRIATFTGDSQWITGEVSRGEVHRLRGRIDAIIIGGGTAAADNPTLTARPHGLRTALRVVVAGKRLLTPDSNLIRSLESGPVMLVTGPHVQSSDFASIQAPGLEIFRCRSSDRADQIGELLDEFGRRQLTNVLVEGGATLLSSFTQIDEVDEIHAFVAPKLIGGAKSPGPVGGAGVARLVDSPAYRVVETARLDDDLRVIVRRVR